MRGWVLGVMIAAGMPVAAAAQDDRSALFISPMGEPFRGAEGGPAPHDQWFDGADTNRDGALTSAEMVADADRFFALLDVRNDGEIDPDDIERYETVLVPEVRGGGEAGRERRPALKGDGGGSRPSSGGFGSPRETSSARVVLQGAARFGYLEYRQPITVADRNFNRGVDRSEFAKAAETRFAALDTNRDGRIEKAELPKLARNR